MQSETVSTISIVLFVFFTSDASFNLVILKQVILTAIGPDNSRSNLINKTDTSVFTDADYSDECDFRASVVEDDAAEDISPKPKSKKSAGRRIKNFFTYIPRRVRKALTKRQ